MRLTPSVTYSTNETIAKHQFEHVSKVANSASFLSSATYIETDWPGVRLLVLDKYLFNVSDGVRWKLFSFVWQYHQKTYLQTDLSGTSTWALYWLSIAAKKDCPICSCMLDIISFEILLVMLDYVSHSSWLLSNSPCIAAAVETLIAKYVVT